VIRALDLLSFLLFLLGCLLLGVIGTWQEAVPFWPGAACLWLSALMGVFTLHWRQRGELSRPCVVALVLFTGYVVWRGLTSEVAYLARMDLVFCATAFLAWAQMAARFESAARRYAVMGVWALLVLGNLGMGLYQKYVNELATPLSRWGLSRDAGDAVFGGFFPNSNHLCGFMELTGFFFLSVAVFGRVQGFVRVLCGLVFAAAAANVAFSTSRGGLAFGIGVLVFAGLAFMLRATRHRQRHGGGSRMGLKFAAAVAAFIAVGWVAWTQLESKFGSGKVFKNLNGRTEVWSRAYDQWLEAPLTGTGARSFEYYERSYRNMDTAWITWHDKDIDALFAHNDWLQMLADYGLAGLLLAVAVLAVHGGRALMLLWREAGEAEPGRLFNDHRGVLLMGALCGLIPFAIHCAADFQMHISVNAVTAAMVLGMIANAGRRENGQEAPAAPPAWRAAAVLMAAVPAAIMAWKALPWAISDYLTYARSGQPASLSDLERLELEGLFETQKDKRKAVEADPLNYQAWYQLGLTEGAIATYFQINSAPGSPSPLVEIYLRSALTRFIKAAELYPQNPYHSMYVASTLDYLGRSDEAAAWWKKALQWGSGARSIHQSYGDHCMRTRQYEKAYVSYNWVHHRTSGPVREFMRQKALRAQELWQKQSAPPPPTP
jgi:O-antigen ligase